MTTVAPRMVYCPKCKDRGVNTPLIKATPTSLQYAHGESPTIVSMWGLNTIICEREVGRHGSGVKCGYEMVLDQRIDNHT